MPTIAGLNFQYFYAAMQAFKKDRRKSTIMGRIAKGYKTSQLQRMALFFGSQPWTGRRGEVDLALASVGGSSTVNTARNATSRAVTSRLKRRLRWPDQGRGYVLYQMTDHRAAATVMPQPPLMQERLEKLSDEDLVALSEFYARELTKEAVSGELDVR